MDPTFLLPAAAFLTAVLSGVLGMGGGLLLAGIYLAFLPVPAAMTLHGVTQLAANGSRAWMLRSHLFTEGLRRYAAAALCALALFAFVRVRLDASEVYLLLGGIPLALRLSGYRPGLDFRRPAHALCCGGVVTAAQLTAGASGPLLDIFFLGGQLERRQVVATKAVTQTLGHLLKILYFTLLFPGTVASASASGWLFPSVVVAAVAGTAIGKRFLEEMNEEQFVGASRKFVTGLCVFLCARGLVGVLS